VRLARQALASPQFVLLWVGASLFTGVMWAVSGLLPQLLMPFGIDEELCGIMGFTGTAVGTVASLGVAFVVDRTRVYKLPSVATAFAAAVALAALAAGSMYLASPNAAAFVAFSLFATASSCWCPIAFEFAVELTFPLDEAISAGLLMWGANFVAGVLFLSLPAVLGNHPSHSAAFTALSVFAGCLVVAFAATCAVDGSQLKRLSYETAKEQAVFDEEDAA
jgi:hypothetical protein